LKRQAIGLKQQPIVLSQIKIDRLGDIIEANNKPLIKRNKPKL
jgi:hypothetical protein